MSYVETLRAELSARISALEAELETTMAVYRAVGGLGHNLRLQLQDKPEIEGGPKTGEAVVVDIETRRPRKPSVRLKSEALRDWVIDVKGHEEFTTYGVADHFNVSYQTARSRCRDLYRQRILQRTQSGWRYNTDFPKAPRVRPRGERLIGVPVRRGSAPVPGTGVPAGPSGKPGELRRQQGRARRVKRKRVGGRR